MPLSHVNSRTLFDRTAEDYQERSEAKVYNFSSLVFQRRIDIVKELLSDLPQQGQVLDYGMGPAVFGRHCTERGMSYLGIDISPKMVERARAMNLLNAEFAVGDLESLGEHRRRMDAVLAIGLLDYLEEPDRGVAALAGCVKPGGHLMLSFRNRFSLPRVLRDATKKVWRALPRQASGQQTRAFFADVHEHSFDFASQLQSNLIRLGFGEFKVQYFNCSPVFFNFPLPTGLWQNWCELDARLAGRWTSHLCSGGVVMAKRVGESKG